MNVKVSRQHEEQRHVKRVDDRSQIQPVSWRLDGIEVSDHHENDATPLAIEIHSSDPRRAAGSPLLVSSRVSAGLGYATARISAPPGT